MWCDSRDVASFFSIYRLCTFLPVAISFLPIIPSGAESTVFALMSTWVTLASEISIGLGAATDCAGSDRTNQALETGNWMGIIELTWFNAIIHLVPILFVFMTVRNVQVLPEGLEAATSQIRHENRSWWGAFLFAFIFFGSIAGYCFGAIYFISNPEAC